MSLGYDSAPRMTEWWVSEWLTDWLSGWVIEWVSDWLTEWVSVGGWAVNEHELLVHTLIMSTARSSLSEEADVALDDRLRGRWK